MDDAARKLGLPPMPQLWIGLAVRDEASGDEVLRRREEGHSWTRNGWNLMFSALADAPGDGGTTFGAGHISALDSANTVRALSGYAAQRGASQAIGANTGHTCNSLINGTASTSAVDRGGIYVGSGNAAFNVNDYQLASLIDHSANGATDGTFGYRPMGAAEIAYTSATKTWKSVLRREFLNATASTTTLTVREVGLYWVGSFFYATLTKYLTARDVLASAVDVAPGQVLTVEYEISMNYSAID